MRQRLVEERALAAAAARPHAKMMTDRYAEGEAAARRGANTNTNAAPAAASTAGQARHELWWTDVGRWLDSLGLAELRPAFAQHDVGPEEVPFLTEQHLEEMGVRRVGDRLRIMESVNAYARAEVNKERRKVLVTFQDWHAFPCSSWFIPTYSVSEFALIVRTPTPCVCCCVREDDVDLTTLRDVKLELGCFLGYVTVLTADPSIADGRLTMVLTKSKARRVFTRLRNLWEDVEYKLGTRGWRPAQDRDRNI